MQKVQNQDFLEQDFFVDRGEPLDPSKRPRVIEKFREITEISERRYVGDDVVASDLGARAAALAVADADIDPESYVLHVINLVVASTSVTPALAAALPPADGSDTTPEERHMKELLRLVRCGLFKEPKEEKT